MATEDMSPETGPETPAEPDHDDDTEQAAAPAEDASFEAHDGDAPMDDEDEDELEDDADEDDGSEDEAPADPA